MELTGRGSGFLAEGGVLVVARFFVGRGIFLEGAVEDINCVLGVF